MRKGWMNFLVTVLVVMGFTLSTTPARATVESGPGNGTDYVKVLFAGAKLQIVNLLSPFGDSDIAHFSELTPAMQSWLLQPMPQGGSRFSSLKYYLQAMDLRFIDAASCQDVSIQAATICFFMDDGPYVEISVPGNMQTTQNQAMAMLIHEAGHMTGEMNHLFLDQVGVALVDSLLAPRVLTASEQSVAPVMNYVTDQSDCDNDTSDQARSLRKKVQADFELQCSNRHLSCDTSKAQYVNQGTMNFVMGTGYELTCVVSATLPL